MTKETNKYKVHYGSDTWTNILREKKMVKDDMSPDKMINDNEMTCAGWWCVRRQRKVYYTTMCTMTDEMVDEAVTCTRWWACLKKEKKMFTMPPYV